MITLVLSENKNPGSKTGGLLRPDKTKWNYQVDLFLTGRHLFNFFYLDGFNQDSTSKIQGQNENSKKKVQ
jgi:hypothetical protein